MAPARRAVSLLGGSDLTVCPVSTCGADGRPFLALLSRKERPTPDAYPRTAGMPKASPL